MIMILTANRYNDHRTWNYLIGDLHFGRSIGNERFQHLRMLNELSNNEMKFCLRDRDNPEGFTKWIPWYGSQDETRQRQVFDHNTLQTAYDVHRSVLENEIVIESDYPSYEENAEAARVICKILEKKGFIPHIYYSGSKSVHVHVYLDWSVLFDIDKYVQTEIIELHKSANIFKKAFMEWLREQMIMCFGTQARKFDEQLIRASHLIRAELSRNKKGFKTFLGYTNKDIPPFPIICNETNNILPDLGMVCFSSPYNVQELVKEYLQTLKVKKKKARAKSKEQALTDFFHPREEGQLKGCVQFMLSEEFKQAKDGYKRAMFYLYNELYKVHGQNGLVELQAWNRRMGSPVREQDILYRFAQGGSYTLSHDTLHQFLRTLGFTDIDMQCTKREQHV